MHHLIINVFYSKKSAEKTPEKRRKNAEKTPKKRRKNAEKTPKKRRKNSGKNNMRQLKTIITFEELDEFSKFFEYIVER